MKSDVSLLRRLGAMIYDLLLAFSLAFFIVGAILIAFFDKQAQTDLLIFSIYLNYCLFLLCLVMGQRRTNAGHENLEV